MTKETVSHAQAALWECSKYFAAYDSAAQRREALGSACAASEAAVHKASAELKVSQDQLRSLKAELKAKSAQFQDLRDRSNAALDEQIAAKQGEWNGIQAAISKAKRELGEVEASLGSLHRRLHIG